jgi:hypothetical protein
MSKFKLKPGLLAMFLPGIGKLGPEGFVEGEQYQRFVPQFLVEVPEEVLAAPVVVTTPKVAELIVPVSAVIAVPVVEAPVVPPAPAPVPPVVVVAPPAAISTPSAAKPVGSVVVPAPVENQVKGKKRK